MRFEARIKIRRGRGRSYPVWFEWARLVPYRFRGFHHWWADLCRFFWLPCPLCGHEFGGHEWRDIKGLSSHIPGSRPSMTRGICPTCTRAGRGIEPVVPGRSEP